MRGAKGLIELRCLSSRRYKMLLCNKYKDDTEATDTESITYPGNTQVVNGSCCYTGMHTKADPPFDQREVTRSFRSCTNLEEDCYRTFNGESPMV
jgi:hypothetical protein